MKINEKMILQRDYLLKEDIPIAQSIITKQFIPENPSAIIVIGELNGNLYRLNVAASIILDDVNLEKNINEIVNDFKLVFFNIEETTVKKDVIKCIDEFIMNGLLVK
jgi:hypothetical protein